MYQLNMGVTESYRMTFLDISKDPIKERDTIIKGIAKVQELIDNEEEYTTSLKEVTMLYYLSRFMSSGTGYVDAEKLMLEMHKEGYNVDLKESKVDWDQIAVGKSIELFGLKMKKTKRIGLWANKTDIPLE